MKPILVFQTDFTYKESAVSAMYGVVKSVDREVEIIDGTHEIPQYDTWSASFRLYQPMNFWPEGTIFVSVVDPGVGTPRKACVAKTANGYYIVTPDNGSLTHVKAWIGITEVRARLMRASTACAARIQKTPTSSTGGTYSPIAAPAWPAGSLTLKASVPLILWRKSSPIRSTRLRWRTG